TFDFSEVIVVVPGQRAGRRLKELLADHAEDAKLPFLPPEVVTEGTLPEQLYIPKFPFASELVQDLAWAQALRELPLPIGQAIVPHPPARDEINRWLGLASILRALHCELAAEALDFETVLKKAPSLHDFQEGERWQALAMLQRRYHELLDKQELWD